MSHGRRRRTQYVAVTLSSALVLAALVVAGLVVTGRGDAQASRPWLTPAPVPAAPAIQGLWGSSTPAAQAPASDQVARRLDGLLGSPALGDDLGAVLLDSSGRTLYQREGNRPLTPASSLKTLTSLAVLATVGPEVRFTTSVVPGASAGEIVLVGGGDPSLSREPAPASERDALRERRRGASGLEVPPPPVPGRLPVLAHETAEALVEQGITGVRLSVDDSRFSGPAVSPDWPGSYVSGGNVAPVTALSADAGRVSVDGRSRFSDPSLATGRLFAEMLADEGITVHGEVGRGAAPATDEPIAAVEGLPVGDLVEHTLTTSDNDMAEVLLRQAARASGYPATFEGGAAAVADVLQTLGIDDTGLRMLDGSGLSRDSRVPPRVLAQALRVAGSAGRAELRPVISGLPVAGFSGTLEDRFDEDDSTAGAGVVRAKTGTLTGVSSLVGMAYDRDGELLFFAVLADSVPSTEPAEDALDEIAAALATCGCATPTVSPTPPS